MPSQQKIVAFLGVIVISAILGTMQSQAGLPLLPAAWMQALHQPVPAGLGPGPRHIPPFWRRRSVFADGGAAR